MTSPTESKSKEGVAIVLAALLGASLMAGGAYWWSSRDQSTTIAYESATTIVDADSSTTTSGGGSLGGEGVGTEPSTDTTAVEPSDDFAEHAVCPTGTDPVICEAAAFVESTRGRAFKEFPLVELVDADEFEQRLLADFSDYEADLLADGATLSALGLIPADANLADVFRESLAVGVVGFYDTITHELVIKGAELNLYAELVIVHELTHAFDDQWFDLDRPEIDDGPDDAAYGFSALVEGNASRVEDAWRKGLSDQDAAKLNAEEIGLFSAEDIQRYLAIPEFILQVQISPYVDGELFVSAVAADGGEGAVDALFAAPPTSSEQALHAEKFADAEPPIPVDAPVPSGDVLDEGSLGEIIVREWLGSKAASGWGGDAYVTWDNGEGERCTDVRFVMDSSDDLRELIDALERWQGEADGRSLFTDGDEVSASACV
ncbi:MAG: hypothetical protein R2706_02435 [Acidimicrobiales bacterium]